MNMTAQPDNRACILELLACPACRGSMFQSETGLTCGACGKSHSFMDGLISFDDAGSDAWRDHFSSCIRTARDEARAVGFVSRRNYALIARSVRDMLVNNREASILDLGCGHGLMSGWLTKKNLVIGADFVPDMLKVAVKRGLSPVHCRIEKIPFKEKCFDVVMAVSVLQYIEKTDAFLSSIVALLKDNGRLIVAAPNANSLARKMYGVFPGSVFRGCATGRKLLLQDPFKVAQVLEGYGLKVRIVHVLWPFGLVEEKDCWQIVRNVFASDFVIMASKV